ncbi:MAG TPA: hypothetical protein VIT91_04535 [Chthoniobacterales bacterium]
MKFYAGKLFFDTIQNSLQDAFAAYGDIGEGALIQDKFTHRSFSNFRR